MESRSSIQALPRASIPPPPPSFFYSSPAFFPPSPQEEKILLLLASASSTITTVHLRSCMWMIQQQQQQLPRSLRLTSVVAQLALALLQAHGRCPFFLAAISCPELCTKYESSYQNTLQEGTTERMDLSDDTLLMVHVDIRHYINWSYSPDKQQPEDTCSQQAVLYLILILDNFHCE